MSAAGFLTRPGALPMAGASSMAVGMEVSRPAAVLMSGSSTLSILGTREQLAVLSVVGTSSMIVGALRTAPAAVSFQSIAAMLVLAVVRTPPDPTAVIEMRVQQKLTQAFIGTQPVSITLTPRAKIKSATGGTQWTDMAKRLSQTMRLIEPPSPAAPRRSADGIERVVEFMLLGAHNSQIGVYDVFDHLGDNWEVVFLYHFNGWERRAEVARHG